MPSDIQSTWTALSWLALLARLSHRRNWWSGTRTRRSPSRSSSRFGLTGGAHSPLLVGLADAILSRYVHARFSNASWVLKEPLKQYLIGTWTGGNNSAGGYAHATLLRPGGLGELAYAREPMGTTRIPGLPDGLRISAIYGERDWMDWRHMARVRANLTIRRARRKAVARPLKFCMSRTRTTTCRSITPWGLLTR